MESRVEIARGWDLFRLGAFAEADSLLSRLTHDFEAVRLLLWIALRRGDAPNKQHYGEMLARCEDQNLSAIGRAHENVALATLGLDAKSWLPPVSKWAQAEVAYARALIAFISDRPLDIRGELSSALPQTPEQRVRYAQLRAWTKALADDFEGQAHLLSHALTLALREPVDRGLIAIIAGSLALIIREIELGEISLYADALLERVEWPVDHTIYRFYAQWAGAWRKATHGDWIPAMSLLDGTLAMAPDEMHKALIHADRARISRALPERVSAASSCRFAFDCLNDANWPDAQNDEALVILSMMDVLGSDRERARPLFDAAIQGGLSKMVGGAHGCRFDAFKSFANSYLSDGEESLRHAQDAYSLFKGMKYIHRAADCALRAVEVGGGSRWRKRVERLVARYPRSLAARQYKSTNSPLNRIQGRRREVVELLVTTGQTAKEIGATLGIAEGTVRVHIKRIKKILSVETRAQLVRLYLEANSAA
jgi:DNA-binding CsgD family transcriptional regulator